MQKLMDMLWTRVQLNSGREQPNLIIFEFHFKLQALLQHLMEKSFLAS